jgi:hypothetical protein
VLRFRSLRFYFSLEHRRCSGLGWEFISFVSACGPPGVCFGVKMSEAMNSDKLVIAVCTRRRMAGLAELVPELMSQIVGAGLQPNIRLLIVDNDSEGSAKPTVDFLQSAFDGVEMAYVVEARGGVGYARNRAFSERRAGEWLIFFDDDQLPGAEWLGSFWAVLKEGRQGMWSGPVTPVFDTDTPGWGGEGWPWGSERGLLADGSDQMSAGFGNILMSPACLDHPACRVTEEFLEGPGEDTLVTLALRRVGFVITFVSAPRATEKVEKSRLTKEWVLARSYAGGRAWAKAMSTRGVGGMARVVLSALKAAVTGSFCALSASGPSDDSEELRMRGRTDFARARGLLSLLADSKRKL